MDINCTLACQRGLELEVDAYLRRRYEGVIAQIQIVQKEDLDLVGTSAPLCTGVLCYRLNGFKLSEKFVFLTDD